MMRLTADYSVCTDPACKGRTCTACGLGITSCCRKRVTCPTTGETHDCAGVKA